MSTSFTHSRYGIVHRTDPNRFDSIKDLFPYKENFITFRGLRMHFVNEGENVQVKNQKVALCLHGEPTWSFLFRKMIPHFVAAGYRVVAPDFIGFGKSDKIESSHFYTFHFHRDSIIWIIRQLKLDNITLVCQDWGGLLGLTIPMDMPERFSELLVMNTYLPTGQEALTEGFITWREFVRSSRELNLARLMKRSCSHLSEREAMAYELPFASLEQKSAARIFPMLVPDSVDAEGAELCQRAKEWWLHRWNGNTFMVIGVADPVIGKDGMLPLKNFIRNCNEPLMLEDVGHFVQEWADQFMPLALAYFKASRFSKL